MTILILCFYAIFLLENWIQKTEKNFPSYLSCGSDVTEQEAKDDEKNFIDPTSSFQTGDFYCYCFRIY